MRRYRDDTTIVVVVVIMALTGRYGHNSFPVRDLRYVVDGIPPGTNLARLNKSGNIPMIPARRSTGAVACAATDAGVVHARWTSER